MRVTLTGPGKIGNTELCVCTCMPVQSCVTCWVKTPVSLLKPWCLLPREVSTLIKRFPSIVKRILLKQVFLPKVGGVDPKQLAVYEEFARNAWLLAHK